MYVCNHIMHDQRCMIANFNSSAILNTGQDLQMFQHEGLGFSVRCFALELRLVLGFRGMIRIKVRF